MIGTRSESFHHKAMKQLIYKFVSEKNKNISESSLEKIINSRRADVYFKLNNIQEIVVEVQYSNISVKEIMDRTKEYNDQNIYVLWILDGQGKCVVAPKTPVDQKNLKISPVEKYLHQMYGGRVYYMTLTFYEDQTTLTPPFALHYSISDNFSQEAFQRNYTRYYIRNANVARIPSWYLLCTQFLGVKIARFHDKNIKLDLKEQMQQFLLEIKEKSCNNCNISFKKLRRCSKNYKCKFKPFKIKKLNKKVLANFNRKYGNSFIKSIFNEIMC